MYRIPKTQFLTTNPTQRARESFNQILTQPINQPNPSKKKKKHQPENRKPDGNDSGRTIGALVLGERGGGAGVGIVLAGGGGGRGQPVLLLPIGAAPRRRRRGPVRVFVRRVADALPLQRPHLRLRSAVAPVHAGFAVTPPRPPPQAPPTAMARLRGKKIEALGRNLGLWRSVVWKVGEFVKRRWDLKKERGEEGNVRLLSLMNFFFFFLACGGREWVL